VNYVFISADKNRHFLNAIFLRPVHPVRCSLELFAVLLELFPALLGCGMRRGRLPERALKRERRRERGQAEANAEPVAAR
jgi:hypothetical protein